MNARAIGHWTIRAMALASLISIQAGAQPSRELQGVVFHLDEHGERVLEKGLTVRLVQTGASTDTNDHGEFRLKLPAFYRPGEKVTVAVEKEGWLVRYPFDGNVRVPADPRKDLVEVELLPKGSKKYLGDDERIERLIAEAAKEAVRQQAAEQQGGAPGIDFSRAIREWATRYGLDPERAKAEVDRWVVEVGLRSDDERQRGLAQLYQKNFVEAAEHFDLAAQGRKERLAQIASERERLSVEEAKAREALVEDLRLEGRAHYEAFRFEASIATWREALGYVSRETSASQWAGLQNNLGITLRNQGTRTAGEAGARLLAEAVDAFRLALQVHTRDDLPQQWATTQNNLGNALRDQGTRTARETGARLLAEAVDAYRLALQVYTRADLPQQWATTQNNLGNVLVIQGTRTAGEAGARLLAEAVDAYRLALQVRTRGDLPQDWAMTQNNLGNALRNQGTRTAGEAGARLLAEAVDAFRLALQVRTRGDLPQQWATTQNNLGNALGNQGTRTSVEAGARLLAEAVDAYRLALQVRTRDDLPQQWAATQNNLGITLGNQGTRTAGEAGTRLLAEAVDAYRLALQVYTREDLPQDWAMTQNNLGLELRNQGTRTAGEAGARLLAEAVDAYRLALQVYTREDLPQQWATTQINLGTTLGAQGTRTAGEAGARLLAEAVDAYRLALTVLTREHQPYGWARARNNLGDALRALGQFDEAASSFRDALEVVPNYQPAVLELSAVYHENLYDHEAAHALLAGWLSRHPDDLAARINFPELLFASQRYRECQKASRELADHLTQTDARLGTAAVLRAFTAASLLAQGDISAAVEPLRTALELIREQPEDFTVGWTFDGTLHFVRHTPEMRNRETLAALFQALDAPDRDAIIEGLAAVVEGLEGGS